MTAKYKIKGMTCQNCVARVRSVVEKISGIDKVSVQLETPQLTIESYKPISITELSDSLDKYSVEELNSKDSENGSPSPTIYSTYKPLFLILLFLIGTTLLIQFPFESFSLSQWMRHFMAGFFLVFSFFKFLNISGFANSYAMYDVIAKHWKGWGYIYPFVELVLGILYLINIFPVATNLLTVIILGISSIGVIQSNLDKKKIKCACLGDVFNLPMSTITIIEDVGMVGMAILMLVIHY